MSSPAALERWVDRGFAAQQAGKLAEAADYYRRVLDRDPRHFDALQLLGLVRIHQGRRDDGILLLQRAATLQPQDAAVQNNLGNALRDAGRLTDALVALNAAANAEPTDAGIALNLGNVLLDLTAHERAAAHLLNALQRHPRDARLHYALGRALRELQRPAEAALAFARAMTFDQTDAHAAGQHGISLTDSGEGELGYVSLSRSVELADGESRDWLTLLANYAGLDLADWRHWPAACAAILRPGDETREPIDPMRAMLLPLSDAQLGALSTVFCRRSVGATGTRPSARANTARVRVGYLSPDFGDHPVCRLLTPVLGAHDRHRVEVVAIGWGPGRGSPHRADLARQVDRFVDVEGLTFDETLARVRAEQLDIAVDLAGYTANAKPKLFAAGVAPVQVGWLGFPGTLGGPMLDYLIADAVSVPPSASAHFAEQVVRLPGTFLPYDPETPIAPTPSRASFGLPEDAVVLACFSTTRKLNPVLWDVWMAALRAAPQSVLWLSSRSERAQARLQQAFVTTGLDPARLVIAPHVPGQAEYLARYRLADVALDTYPYGSHSTAMDVLFAGCPLLALAGDNMPGRVSASVLTAAGLADFVQPSLQHYQETLVRLASDSVLRTKWRTRAAAARDSGTFDVSTLARQLESAFEHMHTRAVSGQSPLSFDLPI
jgi:predicted O-linked N-acetylglucosamine transferase (SPINDLY family)